MSETLSEPVAGERRVVTTEELEKLLEQGYRVYLPEVEHDPGALAAHYGEQDLARLAVSAEQNPVVSVEYLRDDAVQCIEVADEDHLYITDDMIPTHNTSNIVFLKSTDDSMIDTLQKMSGTTHKAYRDSKTITKDVKKVALQTEGKVSYTMTVKEEPVISYNDLAYLSERNSIVFRAGDPPIWNRNGTILPMSWRLFKNTIVQPGKDYSLQTIPTLSSALEFDVRLNQPNFVAMLNKRMDQAVKAPTGDDIYRKAYGYGDFEVSRLDPDVYASEVMDIVDAMVNRELYQKANPGAGAGSGDIGPRDGFEDFDEDDVPPPPAGALSFDDETDYYAAEAEGLSMEAEANLELEEEMAMAQAQESSRSRKRYADNTISRDMLVDDGGRVLQRTLDEELLEAFRRSWRSFEEDLRFRVTENSLESSEGEVYIRAKDESEALRQAREHAGDEDSRVYQEGDDALDADALSELNRLEVTDAFKRFLASLDDWEDLAEGRFDLEAARMMHRND